MRCKEDSFGAPLEWRYEPYTRTRRETLYEIAYRIPAPALRDLPPTEWPGLQGQMIDAMVRLERAFFPHLRPWLTDDFY